MGLITDYLERRVEQVRAEAEKLKTGPLNYLQTNAPARKALLLEYLTVVRPVLGAGERQDVVDWKGNVASTVKSIGSGKYFLERCRRKPS